MKEETHPGELIPFPKTQSSADGDREWEEVVFRAVVEAIRKDSVQEKLAQTASRDPEEIEGLLRTPRFRSRVLACVEAGLVEQVALAAARLSKAVQGDESWAIKLVLRAFGFHAMAGNFLASRQEQSEVVISDAFERDVVERMLGLLRGHDCRSAAAKEPDNEPQNA